MDEPIDRTEVDQPLSFAVLGPLSVRRGSVALALGPPQQSRLLALLTVEANRPVQRTSLIEALWEDRPPASAVNIVQTYVARLRRVLEPQRPSRGPSCLLVSSGTSYSLRVDEERIDAFRFEQLVRHASSLARQGWSEEAFERYQVALGMWRGSAPADCGTATHEPEPLARLSRIRFTAALALGDLGLSLLRFRETADALEPLARIEPLHEALHARVVLALAGAGDSAAALGRFEAIRGRLRRELGISPGEELRRAHRQVLRLPEQSAPAHRPGPVGPGPDRPREQGRRWAVTPSGMGELIGRQQDLGQLAASVSRRPLTTVVGAPGCGKSALALRYAATAGQAPGRRVVVVPLSDCRGSDALQERVLGACCPAGPPGDFEAVLAALHEGPTLLLLDDADHVAEAAAALVERLVRRCPWVRVLVTSREPLGVVGEAIHRVEPLALPAAELLETGGLAALARTDSVALLCRRAEDACGFRLDAANASAVAQLCRLLDGLPLALELAAACLRTMPIEDVVAGLDDRFMLLTMVRRGGPPHHRTLRACLEWSFERLAGPERAVLLRLAGLLEPVSYREVMARCAGGPVPAPDLPSVVNRLVDMSLVSVDRVEGRTRYRVLGTVGAFAELASADPRAAR